MKKDYANISFVIGVLLIILVFEIVWVAFCIIFLIGFYKAISHFLLHIKNKFLRNFLTGLFLLVFIFSIAIASKSLLFDIYRIPSSSMEPSLFPDDVILVNKLRYGPLLPQSPKDLPVVNIAYLILNYSEDLKRVDNCGARRLSGTGDLKNGDIVVFNMPFRQNYDLVKRCIGIAGDTIEIDNGDIFISKTLFDTSKTWGKTNISQKTFLSKENTKLSDSTFTLIRKMEYSSLRNKPVYPQLEDKNWSTNNYGPLIVPKKGMKIKLHQESYNIYNKVINAFECVDITIKDSIVLINNIPRKYYKFKQDYFFMMGDNREHSIDSRFWGFVPKSRILGNVECVLFSKSMDGFNWDRFLKPVN